MYEREGGVEEAVVTCAATASEKLMRRRGEDCNSDGRAGMVTTVSSCTKNVLILLEKLEKNIFDQLSRRAA